MAWCLERFAEIAIEDFCFAEAADFLGKAAELRSSVGSVIDPADQPVHEARLESLRRGLGEEQFAISWGAMRNRPLHDEIEEAFRFSEGLPD